MPINIFTDGGCSKNGSEDAEMGIGVVIEWQGKQPSIISEYAGYGTNNIAEYKALHRALEKIRELELKDVVIKSDSNIMVNQVNGKMKCKHPNLVPLCDLAKRRIANLRENGCILVLEYIPREINVADIPAKNGYLKR